MIFESAAHPGRLLRLAYCMNLHAATDLRLVVPPEADGGAWGRPGGGIRAGQHRGAAQAHLSQAQNGHGQGGVV